MSEVEPRRHEVLVPRNQAQLVLRALRWHAESRGGRGGLARLEVELSDDDQSALFERLDAVVGKNYGGNQRLYLSEWSGDDRVEGAPGPAVNDAVPPKPAAAPRLQHRSSGEGFGPVVGVLDTRICPHRWLAGSYVGPGSVYADRSEVVGNGPLGTRPSASHATFVAGIVAQQAPTARVLVRRLLDQNGTATVWDVANGLVDLKEAGASVINVSLGCRTPEDSSPFPLEVALRQVGPDVPVIASAGNVGQCAPWWPAALDGVIAVGAAKPTDEGWRPTDWSNYGSWVNVWAPGVDLLSTYVDFPDNERSELQWARWSGTSFSAALVTGRIATLMAETGSSAWGAVNSLLAEPSAYVNLGERKTPDGPAQAPLVLPDHDSGLEYRGGPA